MGIELSIFDSSRPPPRYPSEIKLQLICDGCSGTGMVYMHKDGFIGSYSRAMREGWKEQHTSSGRRFLGPCCSRKKHAVA